MLKHVNKPDLAECRVTAAEQTLQVDNVRTTDLGGKASTADFTESIIRRINS
jgi:isocitrate dehydrogenase (NAD+)